MAFQWLTKALRRGSKPEVVPEPLAKRVVRLEIELEELRALVEATWARQRKVEGAVHGMRGANARHPSRGGAADETIEEFRDRMIREGRLSAARGVEQHGEH